MSNDLSFDSRRACGKRVVAGIYAEARFSPHGQPPETFLQCPPKLIDLPAWGITAVGVQLIDFNDTWHVFDVVGKGHYPYVADYVEETRRKGASRRLPRHLDFSKLTPDSHIVLIHEKAIIENYDQYPQPPAVFCPMDKHLALLNEMCAGLWWHDIPAEDFQAKADGTQRYRAIPGGVSYYAYPRPERVHPKYQHGIFMTLPITNLAVIAGRNPEEVKNAQEALQSASLSGLPVYMEEE
jgi:hypothetical protein